MEAMARFPLCPKCKKELLLPLSDYGQDGATVQWKVWACGSDECRYSIRVDKGTVKYETVPRHRVM